MKNPDFRVVIGGIAGIYLRLSPWLTGKPLRPLDEAIIRFHDVCLTLATLILLARLIRDLLGRLASR